MSVFYQRDGSITTAATATPMQTDPQPAREMVEALAVALYEEHVDFINDKDAFDWDDLPSPVKSSWTNTAAERVDRVAKHIPIALATQPDAAPREGLREAAQQMVDAWAESDVDGMEAAEVALRVALAQAPNAESRGLVELPTDKYGETAFDRLTDYAENGTMEPQRRADLRTILARLRQSPAADGVEG